MITKIKAVAAALIAIAGIITSNAAQAADRIPDELLGCWKYVELGLGIRNPDLIYSRVDSEDCKGQMLISSDGWVGDYDVGKIDCRLRSVFLRTQNAVAISFDSSVAKEFCTR